MKEIGEALRGERIARGVSIEFIATETKISKGYLEALEEGDFERLPPGDPYIRGFIRSYARAIGHDPASELDRYSEMRAQEAKARVPERNGGGFLRRVNQTLHWFGL